MYLLSETILPFSFKYSNVLQLVSIVAHSIFYFYFFWLAGTSILSYYFEFVKRNDPSTYFAKILLNYPLKKISFPFVLGLIPFLVVYSIDLIWMQGEEFNSLHNWTLVNLILFLISVFFLYNYKTTFDLVTVLSRTIADKESSDFISVMESNLKKHKQSALFGLIGIVLSLFLFSILSAAKLDYNPKDFRFDIFYYVFDFRVILRFFYYIIVSLSIVFLGCLFFNFSWNETKLESSNGFADFIKKISLRGSLITVLVQPLFIFIELLVLPKSSLSYMIFLSSGLGVILLFIILNQLNAFEKESNVFYLKYSFFLFVIVLISISIRDVAAAVNILKPKTVEIAQKFISYEENLKSKLNIQTVSISGEEIFTAKCNACHRFDEKLVGPPYNDVLKKYENNREQLIRFILNPVRVDPSYPPMPAQGLMPPEAEAVADYLLKVYKERIE